MTHPIPNEYEYLEQLIYDRWQGEVERRVYPIQDKIKPALAHSNYALVRALESEASAMHRRLCDERARGFKILDWLKLDADLRTEGKTLPDVREG